MLLADVGLDVVGEDVARDVDTLRADDAAQRDAGDFRRTTADVDDHVALRSFDVETGAQSCGHRLENHADLAAAGVLGRVANGADFDVGRTRRNADHHPKRRGEQLARDLDFLNHAAQHHLCGREVGDHAVFERADGLDVRVGLFVHLTGDLSDGFEFARVHVERHDGRFVDNDLSVVNYQCVGRSEVDGQLFSQRKKSHSVLSPKKIVNERSMAAMRIVFDSSVFASLRESAHIFPHKGRKISGIIRRLRPIFL